MKADVISRRTVRIINSIVNYTVLTIVVLLITYAGYALWDSNQIHFTADSSHYAKYKPTEENEGLSFKELQALNSEVIAWLSVYGTYIDYPVTQGTNNMKYVDTNAEGQYSLSGSIFLDCNNSKNFDDFNSILFGHHMAKNAMFGEIGGFSNKEIFDSHLYGNIYFNEKNHGIEFFAFIHADAYDLSIFKAGIKKSSLRKTWKKDRQVYIDNLIKNAMHTRDIGVTTKDQLILLSTCSSSSTNGRDILIGRITDKIFEDPFNTKANDGNNLDGLVKELYLLNVLFAVLLIVLTTVIYYRRKNRAKTTEREGAETNEQDN